MSERMTTPADETYRSSSADQTLWQPSVSPEIKVRDVDGEMIMLDKKNQHVHQLDRIGTRILACCDGIHTVDDIVKHLAPEFDVGHKRLAADVATLLKKMRTLGLLV